MVAQLPPSIRLITYASERMPEALIKALIERLPGVSFIQFYGMIEHLCITVLSAADQLRKIGTVGRPMAGAELYLLDEAGKVPQANESGEIVARSTTLFIGYRPRERRHPATQGFRRDAQAYRGFHLKHGPAWRSGRNARHIRC